MSDRGWVEDSEEGEHDLVTESDLCAIDAEVAAEEAAAQAYDDWIESYAHDEDDHDDGAHSFDDLVPVRRAVRGAWMGAAVLFVLALALVAGCELDDPSKPSTAGRWRQVEPYPGAPAGTVCWVWSRGAVDAIYGGPECTEPQPAATGGAR